MSPRRANPTPDFRDFVIWERETNDTIDLKKIYIDMAGDLKAGVMLSQLVYWRLPRKHRSDADTRLTIQRDGRLWLAKSDRDWWAEIRLTPKEALGARRTLEQRGLCTFRVWKFANNPTTHISINEDRFMELWEQLLNTPLEEREAGRIEPRVKRALVRNVGSKPQSGNRRKAASSEHVQDDAREDEGGEGDPRYYQKGNNEITKRVITELPKGQKRNYQNGNLEITERVISYTETPAEIPPEIPSETPAENPSLITDTNQSTTTPDDEGPSPVGEPLNTHTQQAGETPDPLDAGPEIQAEPSAGPEIQPALEDGEDLPFFTGLSPDLEATKLKRAEEVQQVPPAAPAAADPLDAPWAILALTPIPLATLDARPERDPTRMPQLRALMQATSPTRLAHLHEQLLITLPGGVSRQYLTRLTDDEIQAAARAASHDAARVKGGMPSAGYHALDRLLGKEFTPESLSGQRKAVRTNEAPRHRSHQATNDGRFSDDQPAAGEADGALQSGRAWQHMKNGQIVVIHAVENDRTEVVLTDGTRHPMARFVTTYRRVAIAEATG